jgi:hypothetical protein
VKKRRVNIPQPIAAQLLFQNRHRCCVCREPRKPVHLHHIDENPANNNPHNLAVLCLDHHSDVTGSQGSGRSYSPEEILLFKRNWEAECDKWQSAPSEPASTEQEEEETVEPIQSFTKRVDIGADEHYPEVFDLEEGDEITFSVSSDGPIDFMIMTKRQYNRWANDGDSRLYKEHSDITALEDSFEIPKDGNWVVVFCNSSDDDVAVDFDVSAWPGE